MSDDNDAYAAELDGFPLPLPPDSEKRDEKNLERIASDYVDRVRQGESDPAETLSEHPELAGDLADLLPLAQALEDWKTQKEAECLKQNRLQEYSVTQLGDCEIVREIGRGGMGVVFEARQGTWKRPVAVKMLPWRFGDALPNWRERFQQEAQTIARLRHANIVPVYTFGEDQGYCYYVMQLVQGSSLDRILRNISSRAPSIQALAKRLEAGRWETAVRIVVQVCLALEHAHGLGILHNDIKPANLLVDRNGRILATDFSAHRLRTEFEEQTDRGSGTYRYLAPERLAGAGDARSDVYSLGTTLYEFLTLQPAFEAGDKVDTLDRIQKAEFPKPRHLRPELPWQVEAIVMKAMSLDPDDRYQSARDFRRDLMRLLHGRRISIARPPAWKRIAFWCRNRIRRRRAD